MPIASRDAQRTAEKHGGSTRTRNVENQVKEGKKATKSKSSTSEAIGTAETMQNASYTKEKRAGWLARQAAGD